jgi:acetyl esterase/lipase
MTRRILFFLATAALGLAQGPGLAPDRADVSYGPHEKNKLDLWLAKSGKPAPLVVFIHGGGFVGGDKRGVNAKALQQCLDAGVSFASINYRFRPEVPIQVILRDSARAVQYLRYRAKEFNLDRTRVGVFGGSAGAGTSLWLAFHDDLADPQNADPVLRESTRVVAAGAIATQATYDVLQWPSLLGIDGLFKFIDEPDVLAFYGAKSMDELRGPTGARIRADVDMLGLITKDDAPVFLASSSEHDALATRGNVNHTSKHAIAVKKRCDEVGVPAVLKIGTSAQAAGSPVPFLLERLKR